MSKENKKKNKLSLLILIALMIMISTMVFVSAANDTIIADHNAVDDFDDIPDYWIDQVKTMLINIPGESHGTGYIYGLMLLEDQDPKYAIDAIWRGEASADNNQSLRISRTYWTGSSWSGSGGEEDFWTNQNARDMMSNYLDLMKNKSNTVDAFGFGWCWDMTWHSYGSTNEIDPVYGVHWRGSTAGGPQGDIRWGLDDADTNLTGNTVNLQTYLDAVDRYNNDVNETISFFTTGPVDGSHGSEVGYQRYIKHERIRDYVNANGGVLLDYADILSWNDEGVQYMDSWNGHTFPNGDPTLATGGTGFDYGHGGCHVSQNATIRLGKALWWMLARMAGWDGNTNSSCTYATDCPTIECQSATCSNSTCEYVPLTDGSSCSQNGLFCDGSEVCQSGECVSAGNPCSDDGLLCTLTCDESLNQCNTPQNNLCEDNNGCTDNVCIGSLGDSNGCDFVNNMNSCDDGYACTENDQCGGGECNGIPNNDLCISGYLLCNSATCSPSLFPESGCGNFLPQSCDLGVLNETQYSTYSNDFSNSGDLLEISNGVSLSDGQIVFSPSVSSGDIKEISGLVSLFEFEDENNLGLDSISDNDMDDLIRGTPVQSANVPSGFNGHSIELDGQSTLCINSGFTWDSSNDHSLCFWSYKRGGQNQFAQYCGYDTWGNNNNYQWTVNNCNGGTKDSLTRPNTFTVENPDWVYVCQTYDESNNYTKSVIVNGDTQNPLQSSGIPIVMSTSARWCIGSYGSGGYFDGNLYQIAWFDRVLSDSEIQTLYEGSFSGEPITSGYISSNAINTTGIDNIDGMNWSENSHSNVSDIVVSVSTNNVDWVDAENSENMNLSDTLYYRVDFSSSSEQLIFDDLNIMMSTSLSTECVDNETRACGSTDVGQCSLGVETCINGEWSGICNGEITAETEVCDNLDNDCNGLTDDNLGSLSCGVGQCVQSMSACVDGIAQVCDPFFGATTEVCDNVDNDCNGFIDEELGNLSCGLGQCAHTVQSCIGGVTQVCDPFFGATTEVCDNVDNDCNGFIDEELGNLSCGLGQCAHTVQSCIGGVTQVCDPFFGATTEVCGDSIDNDCNGEIDEECISCIPSEIVFNDGIDNDCDGSDEVVQINVVEGLNMVSLPFDTNMAEIVSLFDPEMVIYQGDIYIEGTPEFSQIEFDTKEAFWIKSKADITVAPVFTVENTKQNLKTGLNEIGYPMTSAQNIETALGSQMSSVDYIYTYSETGVEMWNGINNSENTLSQFKPGQGYYISVNSPMELEFAE